MKKVKLADVLWDAANGRLWDGAGDYDAAPYGYWRFSCDAVLTSQAPELQRAASQLLEDCGLPADARNRFDMFDSFEWGEQRQGVRYMWLLLAMHCAEDEGIEIEVAE